MQPARECRCLVTGGLDPGSIFRAMATGPVPEGLNPGALGDRAWLLSMAILDLWHSVSCGVAVALRGGRLLTEAKMAQAYPGTVARPPPHLPTLRGRASVLRFMLRSRDAGPRDG